MTQLVPSRATACILESILGKSRLMVRFWARTVNKKDTVAAHGLVADLEATQAVTSHLAAKVTLVRWG
jgi:hypothetical protein